MHDLTGSFRWLHVRNLGFFIPSGSSSYSSNQNTFIVDIKKLELSGTFRMLFLCFYSRFPNSPKLHGLIILLSFITIVFILLAAHRDLDFRSDFWSDSFDLALFFDWFDLADLRCCVALRLLPKNKFVIWNNYRIRRGITKKFAMINECLNCFIGWNVFTRIWDSPDSSREEFWNGRTNRSTTALTVLRWRIAGRVSMCWKANSSSFWRSKPRLSSLHRALCRASLPFRFV